MRGEYQTIVSPVNTELEIQRSRFLTRLVRVESEQEARAEIASVQHEHPKARHHCTAFVIGARSDVQRSNDDGEPAGTAGAPMLEALNQAELSDVVAVVTRYFGGILLGAGGLTRAYRAAVAEATASATRLTRALRHEAQVVAAYDAAPQIEAWARRQELTVLGAEYGADVTLHLGVAPELVTALCEMAAELSGGQARVTVGAADYLDLP
ncbi:YigZ family protein [Leucobacter sp. UCMA 4100]|uniref:YigZ family protein n=1 Tax=Leucobacter sp. UCMA 4100 TaxID=2810534 RepID=UPI0022EA3B6D|nr:YigZ family protein [Leucobacter sp. UCMA 4100]MDA3146735.1 YigZ family protein [Leucobacter sp. UCMA 4100]